MSKENKENRISDETLDFLIEGLQAYKDDGVVDPWVLPNGQTIEPLDVLKELKERRKRNIHLTKEERRELIDRSKDYIEQAMTGHTCGRESLVGDETYRGRPAEDFFFSSDCKGCCPNTKQHYKNAAKVVVAWTSNLWKDKLEE